MWLKVYPLLKQEAGVASSKQAVEQAGAVEV